MIRTNPSIRAIALDEFTRRRASWLKARREGAADWPGDPANENLTLWTAIALAAGVGRDLPREICAAIEIEAFFPHRRKFLPRADHITHDHAWKGELARARDIARAKAEGSNDQRLIQRALDLTHLANVLGAAPVATPASFEAREAA